MIKWLFFDIGSTLVDERGAYRHRIEEIVSGTDISYEAFYDTMLGFYRQNKKGDLEAVKQYGLSLPKWHGEDELLYPEAKSCLQRLHRSYKIGIIANQRSGTRERLQAFGILSDVDLVIASAEEGLAKPDPAIFRFALQRAGCPPEQSVMIGDRLDNDIAPAKKLGMKTIWVKQGFSGLGAPQGELETPDASAADLDEVCRIIKQWGLEGTNRKC